jgi:hypothetical protein
MQMELKLVSVEERFMITVVTGRGIKSELAVAMD